MKTIHTLVILSTTFCISCHTVEKSTANNNTTKINVNQQSAQSLIIYYDLKEEKTDLIKKVESYGAKIFYDYENLNAIAVQIPPHKTIEECQKYFEGIKGVLQVTQDKTVHLN